MPSNHRSNIAIFLTSLMAFQLFSPLLLAATMTIPRGTTVQLELAETVNSQTAIPGQPIKLRVLNDVTINGTVLISGGTLAQGKVVSSTKSGMVGQPGSISIQVTSVQAVDGSTVPLSASRMADGENKTVVAIIVTLLCLFGIIIKGGEGILHQGIAIEATVPNKIVLNADEK